jgi:hypothetical protein
VITAYRNGDDPYAGGQHRGIDIAAPVGTAVGAAASGTVTFAGTVADSGLTVTVRTADGGYDTSYLHLSSVAVRAGAHLERGERLGAVGTTGHRSAVAAHLHFSVRDAGSRHAYHDPLDFLAPPPASPEPRAPGAVPYAVPAPARPAPAPVRGPAAAPLPRRVTAPARRPAGRRAPVPARFPRRAPAHAFAPRSAAVPVAGGAPSAARALRPHHAGRAHAPGRHRPASLGAAPHVEPVPAAPADRHAAPRSSSPAPGRGPDLGWALACVGLLLTAGLVGGTEEGRAAATRSRARIASALRPLLGRS